MDTSSHVAEKIGHNTQSIVFVRISIRLRTAQILTLDAYIFSTDFRAYIPFFRLLEKHFIDTLLIRSFATEIIRGGRSCYTPRL